MATTSFRGVAGSVTYAGTAIANIKNWSMSVDIGNNDTTAFGETDTSSVMGLRNATGQISGDLSTSPQQNAILDMISNTGTLAAASVVLIVSNVANRLLKYTAASAALTNVQIGTEVAGVASFSASFHLSGGALISTS